MTNDVTCKECGMRVHDECEYHPYAACLMYKACGDRDTVLANLNAVLEHGSQSTDEPREYRTQISSPSAICGLLGCAKRDSHAHTVLIDR
jgi:hypothetical protein